MVTKVKICGITCRTDVEYINEFKPEFAGFVMFFPKSKRNVDTKTAQALVSQLDNSIKSVAVMVSPTLDQIKQAESCGFDYLQIHGELSDKTLEAVKIPVFRAFNVTDIDKMNKYENNKNIAGFVFDAHTPGSGKTFDWSLLKDIPHSNKLFVLAGGLNIQNVEQAILNVKPDVVDVSSGVEGEKCKDKQKISKFIDIVRQTVV